MGESRRDAGLLRALGPWGLAASIVNIVVGAGIFAVPGALAASSGAYGPLVFLFCGVAIGSVALCFAEGGSRVPTSGGVYGYITVALGPLAGFVTGLLLCFSDALACGGVAAAFAEATASLAPPDWRRPARAVIILVVVGSVALVNVSGVARGARLVQLTTFVKLIPLAAFLLAGASSIRASNFVVAEPPSTLGLGRALILASFAFMGMETALSASGEVATPARTIPRALVGSMSFVTGLYIAVQVVAQGILGADLAGSASPLALAMGRVSPTLRLVLLAGAALSMLGFISGDVLGTPRMLFAFARDGLLPGALGRLSRTHAPHVAILGYAALVIGLAWTGTFVELAVLSTLAVAPLYVAGCVAAWLLSRRGVAEAGVPLGSRWLGAATATGVASMLVLVVLASRAEIVGLLAVIGVSTALYLLRTRGHLARSR